MRNIRYALLLLLSCLSINANAQALIGDGVTDNTAIWNNIVSTVCASQGRKVAVPMGVFRFASPMNPIPCSLQVQGEGPGVTNFKFDYDGVEGYTVVGGVDPYGGGSLKDVTIGVASGRTIGFAVHIQAQAETNPNIASHNPHGWIGDNIIVGRDAAAPFTGSFNYGFYLDGSLNASPPAGVAPGIRLVRIYRSSMSAFNILPALSYYSSGSQFVGFNCPVALGSGQYNIMGLHDGGSTFVPVGNPCPYLNGG